jgi:mono/diheme cytochrome c family protein
MNLSARTILSLLLALASFPIFAQTPAPQVSYLGASHSAMLLEVDGKRYVVDLAAQTVRESGTSSSAEDSAAANLFRQNCATCHGADGKGNRTIGTPNFTDASVQRSLGSQQILDAIRNGKGGGRMPAWSGRLTDAQISALAAYVRSFSASSGASSSDAVASNSGIYRPGDDVLVSLPTGRPVDRHGLYVNFSHRFPYDSAVSGTGRGAELFGLDNFALSSFGFRYGVTDKLSVDVWRSPSFIDRPIQLMAAYNLLDEHHGAPLNLAVRASIEGQDNFRKNYTENLDAVFSRSLTSHAQFYFVPTASFNDRRLVQGALSSADIPDLPGINALSMGVGLAVDIRPTVALLAEVIPTVVHADDLGIHRPAFSFGIQKKIYRHAFTLALTNSPGTTVSQRAGTRASFLNDPGADTPAGLFFGFDLTRQIH